MSRLPFDFSKTAAAKAGGDAGATPPVKKPSSSAAADAPITVTQLAAKIDGALRAGFPQSVRFIGEVSGFRDRTHWYFDLKDAGAVVNCVVFQSAAKKAGFTPQNGQQLIAKGRVEFYAPSGRVSVILDSVQPVGAGALELAYRALCEELRQLGWFAQERKRPLPTFPRRIGVVTSRTAAALQDVLVTMKRRCPAVGVLLADCRVQGEGAAKEVAEALDYLGANAASLGIDAIVVTRGGGSMEDLWAFNERIVAHAIVHCPIPVVAAIGHETDTTIAELVADERCATPTQAAMRLTPDGEALLREVVSTQSRLQMLLQQRLTASRRAIAALATRPLFTSPGQALAAQRASLRHLATRLRGTASQSLMTRRVSLERLGTRLERCRPAALHAQRQSRLAAAELKLNTEIRHRLEEHAAHLTSLDRQLRAVSPLRVLERGYSVTTTSSGQLVRKTGDVSPGETLMTRVIDGVVTSRVDGGGHGSKQAPPPDTAPRASSRKSLTTPPPSLFL